MNHLLALLPIATYLIILKVLDSFKLVRWQRLAACVAWGMTACGITIGIEMLTTPPDSIFPVMEEVLKSMLIVWLVGRKKILFFAEALCYGAAIGAGFGIVENITYLYYNPDMTAVTALFRGMGTALMHMGCTALVASLVPAIGRLSGTLAGLCLAMAVHSVYNMFLLSEFLQVVVIVIVFILMFVLVSDYNERRIYRWLDHSITYDVQLLMAIKEGRLADTNTGRYLLSVKEQFLPEVFFDIICYMQLYLELVIQGKSRMLLQQEGLATPLTPDNQQRHDEMLAELHALERNIGIMGKHILHPIIRFSKEDLAVLK